MTKIIFLGTGADSYIVGKQTLHSGGIIIKLNNLQMHIDPGINALADLKSNKLNPRATNVILASHNHLLHINDLNAIIYAMTLNGLDRHGVLIAPESVINNSSALSPFFREQLERIIIANPDKKVAIEDVDIDILPAKHTVECVGFKISSKISTISYITDTSYFAELSKKVFDSDILILNLGDVADNPHNLNIDGAIKLINSSKPNLAIINHFNYNLMKKNPLQIARDIQRETKIQTISARDGLIVNAKEYSAKTRQRKLNNF